MARNAHLQAIQPPETVFVYGSRSFKTLPSSAQDHLNRYVDSGSHIFVGDAPGVDALVQQYLANLNYANVTVFHIGQIPRNNFAFPSQRVDGQRQTDKDIFMAKAADRGLAIWDGKSPGTKQNITRLPSDVITPPVPISIRGQQARADVLAQSASEDVRSLYTVPEGLTRGQHTTSLHHQDPFARDDFERGATVSDFVLSIPRDPDSRSLDTIIVKIGTESHAISFVSGFIADSDLAQIKGQRLYQLAEKACGQWTDTNGRWQLFTNIYDLVRRDESGRYRSNEEKAEVIDQVLNSIAGWAEELPAPVAEPTAEEIHEYTLELAAENQHAIHNQEREEPVIDTVSAIDPRLLYVHELNANSRGLATIGELTSFTLEDVEPDISIDESQVYTDVFESAILDAADLVTSDHLGAEIPSGTGPALDATFDRINLDALPPTIPKTLSDQTQTYLLESLLPTIDVQMDRGAHKQEILSPIYKENRANESQRFNENVEHAFGQQGQQVQRSVISRQDQLNALTSLRLLLAGEYKRETRGFSREAVTWASENYRLDPDQLRAAGQLKVFERNGRTISEYQQLVNDQSSARSQWQRDHQGQQVPYRAQIARINELETAGHKINNRITALDPSAEERLQALRYAQANLAASRSQTQLRLEALAQTDDRLSELNSQAAHHAQTVRASDEFAAAKSLFLHNEHERAIDQQQERIRANSPRFDYLRTPSDSLRSDTAALTQLTEEHQQESQSERSHLVGSLIDPKIESEQFALAAQLREHQTYFTQLTGKEIVTPAEAHNALQSSLSNLDSVIAFADNSLHRLDPNNQTASTPSLSQAAPIYVSLVSNDQLRIPVATLPEYNALTNAIRDCRLETATWRSLHSSMPITGRDEERAALAMFVADYIDFRQSDHVTTELNQNRVFREYAQRLNDTRTTEELIATATAITKENFANHTQQEAHRANPETVPTPEKAPLSLKELRQLFLYATPAAATKSATAEMRSILVSNVFGREKTDRVQLLAKGQLRPSPSLAKLLNNLESRTTFAAVNHFYAGLHNPEPARANAFNLYQTHQLLPQFEKDFLYQNALKAKYDSFKEQPDRTTALNQQPALSQQPAEPSIAQTAKATESYRSYYGNADWREATLCAAALAQQEGLARPDVEQHTIPPQFSDIEVRAINYAVHNFDQTRQTQVVEHLRASHDRHTQTLGDMLALTSEAHQAGAAAKEITATNINIPSNYPVSSDGVQKVISFALQPSTQSLHPNDLAAARELAQHEAWSGVQESLISDPALFVDAPGTSLSEAKELHQLVRSAAELQDRARTAFTIRADHLNSCVQKATVAIQNSQRPSDGGRLPFQNTTSADTTRELVNLVLHPDQRDNNGVIKANEPQFQIVRAAIPQSDIQKAAELAQYATAARNDYLQTFIKLDTGRTALQDTQNHLAERVAETYEQAAKGAASASTRYAAVKDTVERTLIGEHLAQALSNNLDLNAPTASARELLPQDVLTQTAATARDEAWQSFEPQEIRDARAGVPVDERTLNAAYQVMDNVDHARTLETSITEAQQLEAAFQQIDLAIDRLDVTKAEVRMEQQLTQYQQIAQPVAERVNNYLKETTRDEGLKSILEPLRHEGHVEQIALAILQTAHACNVQLDHAPDSLAQVHMVADNLFDTLRDGMERANHHLLQGMELNAELHRADHASTHQQFQHDLQANLNGNHQLETLHGLDKAPNGHATPGQLLDLSRTSDLFKDNPFLELDDPALTSDLSHSQPLNNGGSQSNALTQNPPMQEENSQILDLIL